MDNSLTNNKQTAGLAEAIDVLDRLLAQAPAAREAGEITVVEESLKVQGS